MKLPVFPSCIAPGARRRGIALVVTLILLSVITFLAVAFLFLARRERGSVATTVEQSVAKLATEAAVERAKAEMIADILAVTNKNAYGLRVSTNFFNALGFDPNAPAFNTLTNVNYEYRIDGSALTAGDLDQNLANLYYSPRPPVFVETNRNFPTRLDFRFYLDLNRNGAFEPNGGQPEVAPNAQFYSTNGGFTTTLDNARSNTVVGDPEWIGVLDRPDRPHGPNNKFVARYAYAVVPSGKTLDLNTIHNQAKQIAPNSDGFSRNMGVGTWEFNLAAFLADLNTNIWCADRTPAGIQNYYDYATNINQFSRGVAFEDARDIVRYRYGGNYASLASVENLFGNPGRTAFLSDRLDGYGRGPLMLGRDLPPVDPDNFYGNTPRSWSGAGNTNHFTSPQELFDSTKLPPALVNRMLAASRATASYDRYTFYRLLSQLGTDTGPEEPATKIHLNYRNVTNGVVVRGLETNFAAWTPLEFFTNAVDRLLQANFGDPAYNQVLFGLNQTLSLTNIPVLISNRFVYRPTLHRVMQLAANITDSRTNYSLARGGADLPSVFRPTFRREANGDVYVAGWVEVDRVTGTTDPQLSKPLDLNIPADVAAVGLGGGIQNVYGVPWVIGAKKGLPNFNEFSMQSVVGITRRLQLIRPSTTSRPTRTNQMFMVGISNAFGFEAWNPYVSNYNRDVRIIVENDLRVHLACTNDSQLDLKGNAFEPITFPVPPANILDIPANVWRGAGFSVESPSPRSFIIPLFTNFVCLSNAVYRAEGSPPIFVASTNRANAGVALLAGYENTGKLYNPQFNLAVSNRIRFIMLDTASQRVIDYVHLSQMDGIRDLSSEVNGSNPIAVNGGVADVGNDYWETNRPFGNTIFSPPQGVINQIRASLGEIATGANDWNSYGVNQATGNTKEKEIAGFRAFMRLGQLNPLYAGTVNTNLVVQAPFTPTRRTSQTISWQANDPLVHYTKSDITYLPKGDGIQPLPPTGPLNLTNNLGILNERFEPWSQERGLEYSRDNLALKDPGVRSPNDWNFPTNQYATVGWLGRVHRGTPWQTVYFKSADIAPGLWTNWTGNANVFDAFLSRPAADRVLPDVFTTALSDSATRGQLNVNQDGLAAWSAALGALIALTNDVADAGLQFGTNSVSPVFLLPAGADNDPTNSAVHKIWEGINRARTDTNIHQGSFYSQWFELARRQIDPANSTYPTNFINRYYPRLGSILDVPELSVESPVLNRSSDIQKQRGIDDATYERLPQMLLGLLRGNESPRFTIYAYGQSLKPAERSIATSGTYAGLCRNYQITAEFATRTVVRLDVLEQFDPQGNKRLVVKPVVESYNVLGPNQ